MRTKGILLILALGVVFQVSGQKIKQDGNLSFLKGQTEINVEFVYPEGMIVGKVTEEEYIARSMADREEKVVGDGDRWLKGWKGSRESIYHPKFMSLFNRTMKGKGAVMGTYPDAKYTAIVEVVKMEPGFHAHVMKKNAEIDMVVHFAETENKDHSLGAISITRAPGRTAMGGDYSVESRLQESYAVSGKRLAIHMMKKVF